MPRIPRRTGRGEEPPPEAQRTISSGDPLAPSAPAPESAATIADDVTPDDAGHGGAAGPADAAVSATESSDAQPTVTAPAVEQPTAVLPTGEPVAAQASGDPVVAGRPTSETGDFSAQDGEQAPVDARPRFRQRTRMRRRLRYLRRLRELAFRDLGGLVFDLHRFGRDRNDLVTAKLEALTSIDRELRLLQEGLQDRRDFTDLREAGIAACPRCGTLHDTDANFCPGCGTTLRSAIVRDAFPVTVTPADGEPQQPTSSS